MTVALNLTVMLSGCGRRVTIPLQVHCQMLRTAVWQCVC
jgi:hypothetical protein